MLAHWNGSTKALDHPTRRRILAILLASETHVSQLARDLQVSRPVIHVHLARLQEPAWSPATCGSPLTASRYPSTSCCPLTRLTPEVIAAATEPVSPTATA